MNSTCIWLLYKYLDEEWLVKAFEFFSDLKRDFHWSNDWKNNNKQTNKHCLLQGFQAMVIIEWGQEPKQKPEQNPKIKPQKIPCRMSEP